MVASRAGKRLSRKHKLFQPSRGQVGHLRKAFRDVASAEYERARHGQNRLDEDIQLAAAERAAPPFSASISGRGDGALLAELAQAQEFLVDICPSMKPAI